MKRLLLIFFLLIIFISTKGYTQESNQEKLKSLKIGFLTQELNLTSKEAQGFWPIYNKHQKDMSLLRSESRKLRKNIRRNGGIEAITNAEAEKFIHEFLEIETKIQEEQVSIYKHLKSILPAKKILKLHRAEQDFNRKLLERLKKRSGNFKRRN